MVHSYKLRPATTSFMNETETILTSFWSQQSFNEVITKHLQLLTNLFLYESKQKEVRRIAGEILRIKGDKKQTVAIPFHTFRIFFIIMQIVHG